MVPRVRTTCLLGLGKRVRGEGAWHGRPAGVVGAGHAAEV
jgi:hypothetical protein